MGNRAIVYFEDSREVSAGVYLHWAGSRVPELILKTYRRMLGTGKAGEGPRFNDAPYAAARFCGIAHTSTPGNLSLGILAPPKGETVEEQHASAVRDDASPGDAGAFIVDVRTKDWRVQCADGYGLMGSFRSGPGTFTMVKVRSAAKEYAADYAKRLAALRADKRAQSLAVAAKARTEQV